MSTTRNTDGPMAPEGGSGEFHPRVERDEPMMTSGVSEEDEVKDDIKTAC